MRYTQIKFYKKFHTRQVTAVKLADKKLTDKKLTDKKLADKKLTDKKIFGNKGEDEARLFLCSIGLRHIKSNYVYDRTEIDIISEDVKNKILIFTEVKTRKNRKYGEPEESINIKKQMNIRKTARGFLSENNSFSQHDYRFDTITILYDDDKPLINHIENAF